MLVVPRTPDFHSQHGLRTGPYPSPDMTLSGRAVRHHRHDSASSHNSSHNWRLVYPGRPCILERLPQELQRKVFSHLDYQSLIHLSTQNRYFHKTVDSQRLAHPTDKAEFVMRAAKDFPQHRPSEKGHDFRPGNFECYICFRVRGPEHFDGFQPQAAWVDRLGRLVLGRDVDPQTDTAVHLRRFCIECGVRDGLHAPYDCLTTKTGCDLWVCPCRRVWTKPATLKCGDCGADCPLRPRRRI